MATRALGRLSREIDASNLRLAVIVSDYHATLGELLLAGALRCLQDHGGEPENVWVFRVPGAFEIPQAVSRILARHEPRPDAVIALGVLIRGETLHFEILAREVCRSLQEIGLSTGVPVTFGVLTVNSDGQARDRAGRGRSNKGWEAAHAALRMASLFRRLEEPDTAEPASGPGRRRRAR